MKDFSIKKKESTGLKVLRFFKFHSNRSIQFESKHIFNFSRKSTQNSDMPGNLILQDPYRAYSRHLV